MVHARTVPPRERPVDRGARRGREIRVNLGHELREARLLNGLTQAHVARAAGTSRPVVSRIEAGAARAVSVEQIARLLAVVGMELWARAYPAGSALRDAAHLALLERLRKQIGPAFRWRTEVPVGPPGDQRAWDALLTGIGVRIAIEAETRLRDLQALLRRLELKRRDGQVDRLVLLVADTRANRAVLREAAGLLAESFPVRHAVALAALSEGRDPGGDAIVLL